MNNKFLINKSRLIIVTAIVWLSVVACQLGSKGESTITSPNGDNSQGGIAQKLELKYDTLLGIVTLKWESVKGDNFIDYLVYRDGVNPYSLTNTPLIKTSDTVAYDTIFRGNHGSAPFSMGDTNSYLFDYRIRYRNGTDKIFPSSKSQTIRAVSPTYVQTYLQVTLNNAKDDTGAINDTITMLIQYTNRTRKNMLIEWFQEGNISPLRSRKLSSLSGMDTLKYISDKPSVIPIEVRVTDESGKKWETKKTLTISSSTLLPNILHDTLATTGQPFHLVPLKFPNLNAIVKWEWDIGNEGNFRNIKNGDTVITVPGASDSSFICILRVTDKNGKIEKQGIKINVVPWRQLLSRPVRLGPKWGMLATEVKGQIYAYGYATPGPDHQYYMDVFDPVSNSWDERQNIRLDYHDCQMISTTAYLYLTSEDQRDQFDPLSHIWKPIGGLDHGEYFATDDRLYVVSPHETPPDSEANSDYLYDAAYYQDSSSQWTNLPVLQLPDNRWVAFTGNKILFIGKSTQEILLNGSNNNYFKFYYPPNNTWVSLPVENGGFDSASYLGEIDGKIFLKHSWNKVIAIDPISKTWQAKKDIPIEGESIAHLVSGKIVVVSKTSNGTFAILVYDSASDTWSRRTNMTGLGDRVKHFAIGGSLYFFSEPRYSGEVGPNPEMFEYQLFQ